MPNMHNYLEYMLIFVKKEEIFMNIRKFVSGISAFAVAVTAFASDAGSGGVYIIIK